MANPVAWFYIYTKGKFPLTRRIFKATKLSRATGLDCGLATKGNRMAIATTDTREAEGGRTNRKRENSSDVLRTGIASLAVVSPSVSLENCLSFLVWLSRRMAVTVPLYENAIPEIFYLLPQSERLDATVCQASSPPCFSRVLARRRRISPCRRPPRRLRILCPLSLFLVATMPPVFSFLLSARLSRNTLHATA